MSFKERKTKALYSLEKAVNEKLADEEAIPLLDEINSKKDFFTSSSCYGRIMLIRFLGEKGKSNFVKKWHRKVSFEEVKEELNKADGLIWLRMEPLILHVSCRNVESADLMLKAKETAGIKRGGIFNIQEERVQIEIEGTQRVEALLKKDGRIIVDDEYIDNIVKIANERFDKNVLDWEKLFSEIRKL